MQYRVLGPVIINAINLQTGKQIPPSPEEGLKGRYEQTLSETPRTTHEIILPFLHKLPYVSGLVDVDVSGRPQFLKALYSDRVLSAHGDICGFD